MIAFSVCMACVLALTAVPRATLRWRIISTALVPDFGRAVAWPPSTARAALSASTVSLFPFWRRSWQFERLTSNTAWPRSRRKRDRPAPYEPVPSIPTARIGPSEAAHVSRSR